MATSEGGVVEERARAAGQSRDRLEAATLGAVLALLEEEFPELSPGGSAGRTALSLPLLPAQAAFSAVARTASLVAWTEILSALRDGPVTPIEARGARLAWESETATATADRVRAVARARGSALSEAQKGLDGDRFQDVDPARHDAWARGVARTEATRLASTGAIDMARLLDRAGGGAGLRKVWISRGDSAVRDLHRKLHGESVEGLESPFWSWGGGQQLAFPGDPRGPLGEVINCRCMLMFVPTSVSADEVRSALGPASLGDEAFALAASALGQEAVDDDGPDLVVVGGDDERERGEHPAARSPHPSPDRDLAAVLAFPGGGRREQPAGDSGELGRVVPPADPAQAIRDAAPAAPDPPTRGRDGRPLRDAPASGVLAATDPTHPSFRAVLASYALAGGGGETP